MPVLPNSQTRLAELLAGPLPPLPRSWAGIPLGKASGALSSLCMSAQLTTCPQRAG